MYLLFFSLLFLIIFLGFIILLNGLISYGNYFFYNFNIFEKIIIISFSFLLVLIISLKGYSKYELISDYDTLNYIQDNNININNIDNKDIYLIKDIIICQKNIAYDKYKIKKLLKEESY